jgi:hypothetical protein
MKTQNIKLIFVVVLAVITASTTAKEIANIRAADISKPDEQQRSVLALCSPSTAQADLDINNVRTRILGGGDMWWDLQNGMYFVPKPAAGTTGPTSLYAGALWIGGKDPGGTLKVAAQTYRQTGNDFWPGPLDNAASTDATICSAWDKIWKINRKDVEAYYGWAMGGFVGPNPTSSAAMDVINNWPVTAPDGHAIAPFYDINNNGIYEPQAGEVPDFDVTGTRACEAQLSGDQCLFWVFNDKGNIHSATSGTAIGLEVHAQAFAFQTSDEINNMTFYRYKIINRSSFRLDTTFFGVWVDPDLGSANDDYVGCDVGLGLGFCYNGDEVDDNPPAGQIPYGVNPPAIGIDFFEGPFADPDGIDNAAASVPASFLNYGNATIDDERIGMKKFVYYNNGGSFNNDPSSAIQYYNYLRGIWIDGTPMTYGGNGHLTGVACDYAMPGSSDPLGYGTNMVPQAPWDEVTAGNLPADRRFLQSAGYFTLQPGAVNKITTGAVWARATQGGNLASVALMKGADAKAQKLFDRCFKTLDGPTAPNLAIQELNQELILTWTNPKNSNNYKEWYTEDDNPTTNSDSLYRFQGYMIYQLKDATVSASELYNPDKARLVFQCDKKDQVKQIVNYNFDLGITALVSQEMVNGADEGIVHSISIKDDKFATGNSRLVNHKTYYYAIIAYGYSPTQSPTNLNQLNDYLPFLAGRKQADGYFAHTAIPHIPSPEANGTIQNSYYGIGPKLTRIEGQGNGGNILDFTEETAAAILASPTSKILNPTYQAAAGPVNIKVVDPLNVPVDNDFTIYVCDSTITSSVQLLTANTKWKLVNNTTGEVVFSEKNIQLPNEQIINGQVTGSSSISIPKWGISVNVTIAYDPGNASSIKNGFLEATMSFSDLTKQWLTGIPDAEGLSNLNWIRSGTSVNPPDWAGIDNDQVYEKVLGGTWAPYRLTYYSSTDLSYRGGAAWNKLNSLTQMRNLASVDVVFTSDKSKWTRCPVLEMQDEPALAIGGAIKHNMRKSPSVDKNGLKAGDPGYNSAEGDFGGTQPMGMGWFPGYALNLETGERLNMAFGEDSYYALENGADMLWNPTSTVDASNALFCGKHYIYVFGHNGNAVYSGDPQMGNGLRDIPAYDQGVTLYQLLKSVENTIASPSVSDAYKREVYIDAMWVNMPRLVPGHALLESTAHVRLRVSKAYRKGYATTAAPLTDTSSTAQNRNHPMYIFNTKDIQTVKSNIDAAKDALALINVVPNPYYAYSSYEKTALENLVKITNLPEKCTVTIYTLNGTQIRKFKKDDTKTSLDWDLKNAARIPIASGLYIIHVDVPGVGEKTLKWFGVLRPIDLDNY